jgi:hypothetical protein
MQVESRSEEKRNKIYLLKRIYSPNYGEFVAKVIVASSAKEARKMANTKTGDEGPSWTNSDQVICKEISTKKAQIVLEDFMAG